MERKQKAPPFDDKARDAAEYLMERFWILREDEPELYQMVREREKSLRTYFTDKLGFHLIIHRYFVKLEKLPAWPEPWMGVDALASTGDYTLFCCFMAFLESKNIDEQFLLSDLCEALTSLYPGEEGLDWTNYSRRRSLVRVLQHTVEERLIKVVEGDITGFGLEESHEVLLEVPPVSRYFMPSYPKELPEFSTLEEIYSGRWRETKGMEEHEGMRRRHRVYRRLFLSPAFYSSGAADPDFLYLRNFRHRIAEDVAEHTPYRLELYANAALLVSPERKGRLTLFPENRAISEIAMQLAVFSRERWAALKESERISGSLSLSAVEFEQLVVKCKEQYGAGWSKEYREALPSETTADLLCHLLHWKMADQDPETGVITLLPLLARVVCRYPDDFGGDRL
jgi:uncharacterized protein (TIGR02678 family)